MWFYSALATALISAVSVILNKRMLRGVSPSVLTWSTLVCATPVVAFFAWSDGIPSLNKVFWIGVIGSVLCYTASKIVQFRAMKIADLSAIYPLVALGPVVTLLVAFLPPLEERPGFMALAGMVITLCGAYILNVSNAKEGLLKPLTSLITNNASGLMILAVVVDGFVVVFDKLAINSALPRNTTFVLLIENIFVIIGLLPIIMMRNKRFIREIIDYKYLFIIVGVLNAVSTTLAFSAVGGGNIGIVSTILKSQMLFVLLLSFLFFKDKPKFETVIGSVIMILGVVLIKIGSW